MRAGSAGQAGSARAAAAAAGAGGRAPHLGGWSVQQQRGLIDQLLSGYVLEGVQVARRG